MTRLQMKDNDILTVSDLRKINNDPSLWVLNTSDLMGAKPQGDVLIEIDLPNGRKTIITVPKTWVPIDISAFARRDHIIESQSFLQAVNRQTLTPVSSEFADSISKRQDVRDERNLLAIKAGGINITNAIQNRNPSNKISQVGANINPPTTDIAAEFDNISPRVISIMESENLNPDHKLISLKGLTDEIQGKELRYILSKCGPEHERISKWVNDMAKAIQAAGGSI